jgi:hypothetical protein
MELTPAGRSQGWSSQSCGTESRTESRLASSLFPCAAPARRWGGAASCAQMTAAGTFKSTDFELDGVATVDEDGTRSPLARSVSAPWACAAGSLPKPASPAGAASAGSAVAAEPLNALVEALLGLSPRGPSMHRVRRVRGGSAGGA